MTNRFGPGHHDMITDMRFSPKDMAKELEAINQTIALTEHHLLVLRERRQLTLDKLADVDPKGVESATPF